MQNHNRAYIYNKNKTKYGLNWLRLSKLEKIFAEIKGSPLWTRVFMQPYLLTDPWPDNTLQEVLAMSLLESTHVAYMVRNSIPWKATWIYCLVTFCLVWCPMCIFLERLCPPESDCLRRESNMLVIMKALKGDCAPLSGLCTVHSIKDFQHAGIWKQPPSAEAL